MTTDQQDQSGEPGSAPHRLVTQAAGAQLWGGRFEGAADPLFRAFNDSLPFDWALVHQDIRGSIAWAEALGGAGVLDASEVRALTDALERLSSEASEIGPNAPEDAEDEDVHSWVEARLVGMLGSLGKKLHTGRSRNDQVATDLRLWTRSVIEGRLAELYALQAALIGVAEVEAAEPMPGFTHLQSAQPVTIGHWALAYVEMLDRDAGRLRSAGERMNLCPLGSAALAGSGFAVDRERIADLLGFAGPTLNSLDAVSDRDFVVESLSAYAILMTHLSRLAEELVVFASGAFGMVAMDDSVSSGSSIMPQKKNPDACELIRGKAGRVNGSLVHILTVLKGLSLAYNKDMQEDKEPLFDATRHVSMSLRMAERVVSTLRFNHARCRSLALAGYANATELADGLAEFGVPFREAHDAVGRIVNRAVELEIPLESMSIEEMQRAAPAVAENLDESLLLKLTVEATLDRRSVIGGTAPERVKAAAAAARVRLEHRLDQLTSQTTNTASEAKAL